MQSHLDICSACHNTSGESIDNQQKRSTMFGLGTQEILIIALIILLLFGGKKIPELMKGLGKGVKSFKEGMNSIEEIDKDDQQKKEETKEKE